MKVISLDKALGTQVEFDDPVTQKTVRGTLDYDENFKVYHIKLGESDKYRPNVGSRSYVADGKITDLLILTKEWDRYDEKVDFQIEGEICTIEECDFDKGTRTTQVNKETGEFLSVNHPVHL